MPEEKIPIGVKNDSEKRKWGLLPWKEVGMIVDVLMAGEKKYSAENWKFVKDARRRYFEAMIRHVTAWWNGEVCDPDDNLHHLAHALCCCLFLLWFDNNEVKK
jgi:hypothetical protein